MEVIKAIPEDWHERKSSSDNLNFLLRYSKVYVMDNHLAAGWCWLQELNIGDSCCFFHVDQHQDLLDGGPLERYAYIGENPQLSIDEYTAPEYNHGSGMSKVVRWDTYIKQMQHISPSWFAKCFFACPEIVHDSPCHTDLPLNNIMPIRFSCITTWIIGRHNMRSHLSSILIWTISSIMRECVFSRMNIFRLWPRILIRQ